MIYRRAESVAPRQGINWTNDKANSPMIVIKVWRLMIFFRRRSKWVWEGNKHKKDFPRTTLKFVFLPREVQ